jgi:hypothetical protein
MEYALFLGLQKVGSLYPNPEEAKLAITSKGIWNICGVVPVDGKLKIVSRLTIDNRI